jgi:two-component system, NarL family, sensor histidine kinase BarA
MSYRSIKRHLGESHLQRKFLALFFVCFLLMIGLSFSGYMRLIDRMVAKQNPTKGKLLSNASLLDIHFRKFDLSNYRPGGPVAQVPNPDWTKTTETLSAGVRRRDYDWTFFRPEGAYMPDPGEPSAVSVPRDAFEADLIDEFANHLAELDESGEPEPKERFTADNEWYEYYRPVYAQHECVRCHKPMTGPPDLAEGDLIAVVKVSISNTATRQEQTWNRALLWTFAVIVTFLAMVAAYLILRYVIAKPLKHLRDVSDAVSHGNLQQRAEINTADEFEDLAVAFNRMLGNLINAQEELRRLNGSLDVKVDELAQANMRLFELNRLKSDFLATMSHELRTPLNSIIGFSDVLGSIRSLDDKQRRYVLNIQKSGKMLLDMINDILDLAKIESGKMDLRPSRFRVESVIAAQCDMARPLAERKNLDLETDIEPSLPELLQDQGKVQQVLNNLLSNAIKFTPDGGRIVVAARRAGHDELALTITDTGVGISEEDQTRIFEKFRQGNTVMPGGDAMTREYSGTGLGLSIVKELCKLLGGDVSVDSDLGRGSTFTVRLPLQVDVRGGVGGGAGAAAGAAPSVGEGLETGRPQRDEFLAPVTGQTN